MGDATWSHELDLLRRSGASLAPGLSPAEFAAAEARFGFRFPPDLRSLLSIALPLGDFPNWRDLDSPELLKMLAWPVESICFDIEHNGFWWPEWGERPGEFTSAIEQSKPRLAAAPFLIPVYGHRYLPAEPLEAGNPVLSVWQTDIVYYGRDLRSYLANEFAGLEDFPRYNHEVRQVRFWSELIDAAP